MDENKYLSHHGIMGMKWGVWNDETQRKRMGGTKRRAKNSSRELKAREKERKKAYKNVSLLSDKELDKRIKRLEKEKRFRELTESEIYTGKKYAKDLLAKNSTKVVAVLVGAMAAEIASEMVMNRKDTVARRKQRQAAAQNFVGKTLDWAADRKVANAKHAR